MFVHAYWKIIERCLDVMTWLLHTTRWFDIFKSFFKNISGSFLYKSFFFFSLLKFFNWICFLSIKEILGNHHVHNTPTFAPVFFFGVKVLVAYRRSHKVWGIRISFLSYGVYSLSIFFWSSTLNRLFDTGVLRLVSVSKFSNVSYDFESFIFFFAALNGRWPFSVNVLIVLMVFVRNIS